MTARTFGLPERMIIDSHTHILPDDFRTDTERFLRADQTFRDLFSSPRARSASAGELIHAMNEAGVDMAVAAGYGWTSIHVAKMSNDYILEAARRQPDRIIPFCSASPLWGREAVLELERCAAAGARGIGELHPDSQGFLNSDFATLAPFFDAARSLDLPVLLHTSEPVGHSYRGKGTVIPELSLALAEAFPQNRFIFAHFGGGLPFYSLMPEVRTALKNVRFDSAASPLLYGPQVYRAASDAAGADSLLFGSDYPLVSQRKALDELERSGGLDDHETALVLGKNAARFLSTGPGRRPA